MADVDMHILEPATSFAFLTLEELKIMLGGTFDAASDPQLQLYIDTNSAVIAAKCGNRIFAKEKVREVWRELQPNRLFLTHWPVKTDGIESVKCNGVDVAYELEENSGKVRLLNGQAEPIEIIYTGGYELPTEAPMALKQATGLMVGISRRAEAQAATAGIRMIAHKEKRVMFYDTSGSSGGSSGGSEAPTLRAIDSLLVHFTRWWV